MRWGEAWRVIRVLNREAVYGAHRGSDPTLDELKLLKLVRWNRIVSLVENLVAVLLILLMICPPVLLAGPKSAPGVVRDTTMLYNMMLFMLVFMVGSTSTLSLQELGFLKVLFQLPLSLKDFKKIVMAYLIHEIMPVLFIPPIYALVVAEKLWYWPAFPLTLLYGYASITLGLAASTYLSIALWKRRGLVKGLRSKLTRAFWNGLYVITMFSIGILYQAYAYADELLALIREARPRAMALTKFIYPFSASEAVLPKASPALLASSLVAMAYSAIFLWVLNRALTSYTERASYALHEPILGGRLSEPRPWLPWPQLAIALKDLKVAVREPRTSYIMVLPLFSIVSFLPVVLTAPTPDEFRVSICLMFMTLFILGCLISSLVPYQLMEHEGGRLWIIFSCASKKQTALGKSLAPTLAYMAYAIPVGLAASLILGKFYPLFYALSGTMVAFSTSLLSSMIMVLRTSVDTRIIRISLLRSLALLALSAVMTLPLMGPLLAVDLSSVHLTLANEYGMALLIPGLEMALVLVLNELATR